MQSFLSYLTAFSLVLTIPTIGVGQEIAPREPEGFALVEQPVSESIEQLSAPSFAAREEATAQLLSADLAAIEPLVQAIKQGDLEVMSRGIHILHQQALSADSALEEAACLALELLATDQPSGIVSQRAASTLQVLAVTRRQRAIEELASLGAVVGNQVASNGTTNLIVYSVLLDERWEGTADDLKHFRWISGIRQLSLIGEHITDDYLSQIRLVEDLQYFNTGSAQVTAAGLQHLREQTALKQVQIRYSPIGDEIIDILSEIEDLQSIKLYGTEITEQGEGRLALAIPDAKLDIRSGGFLGIGCAVHPAGCRIITVQPNSAAERAGLRITDVITHFEGEPAPNFETLTEHIAEHQAGVQLTVSVLRGNTEMEIEVELGEWEWTR